MSKVKAKLVEELHAPARRNFPRRRVVVRGFDDLWQADLVEVQSYAKENRGFRYILTVIDVFSKYAWAVPLKSKGASDVTKAFTGILETDGRVPQNLQTDMGKEFYNKDFQKCMKKHTINHYSTFSVMKASVVERFNRTLKNAMWKSFSLNGGYRWTNILGTLVADYNRRKHRTIQMRPIDVTRKDEKHLLATAYDDSSMKMIKPAKFKIGDKVRISKFKSVFDKGYTPNWSAEVFEISGIKRTKPVVYFLNDYKGDPIAGGFYELELHKAMYPDVHLVEKVLRKKGDMLYVKWLGFDKIHNSWIKKKDVV